MKVRVKLFAAAKELVGRDTLEIEVPAGATIASVRAALIAAVPELDRIVSHSLWAVGAEYVSHNTPITEQSDLALIPPVSGG